MKIQHEKTEEGTDKTMMHDAIQGFCKGDGGNAGDRQSPYIGEEKNGLNPLSALTPTIVSDDQFEPYLPHFDYVFNNDSIRNVALSGPYASGKTSLIDTLICKAENQTTGECNNPSYLKRKYLRLSLAHFPNMNQAQNSADFERQLEGFILSQLSQQVPKNKAPRSRIQHKTDTTLPKRLCLAVAIPVLLFVLALSILFFSAESWYQNDSKIIVTFVVTWLLLAGVGTYHLVKYRPLYALIRRLKVGSGEIELFSKDDSLFDRYLDDVIYLLDASEADVVVFEDLDRFGKADVFERLRGINEMINAGDRIGKPKGKHPIRFFYLVKDDLFTQESRRKFFDYIIPVIPYITPSNSFELLQLKLSAGNIKPNENFLILLSMYIQDSRALYDIVNESICYRDVCFSENESILENDANHLVALMAYKVFFPEDFALLQFNQGYMFDLLERISRARVKVWDAINKKLESIDQYYDEDAINGEQIDDLKLQQQMLYDDRSMIDRPGLGVLLKYYQEESGDIFEITSRDQGDIEAKGVVTSPWFKLIRFLVTNGYIDSSYPRYISRREGGALSALDQSFFFNALQGLKNPAEQTLDDPAHIVALIDERQIILRGFRNYSIARKLASRSDGKSKRFFDSISADDDWKFIVGYILSGEYSYDVYGALWESYPSVYSKPLNEADAFIGKRRYLQRLLSDARELLPPIEAKHIVEEAENDELFLKLESGINADSLCSGLKIHGYKIRRCDYEAATQDVLGRVLRELMFVPSEDTLQLVLIVVLDVSPKRIEKEGLIPLLYDAAKGGFGEDGLAFANIIEEELPNVIKNLLGKGDVTGSRDENVVKWVLENEGVNEEMGLHYIDSMNGTNEVESLDVIKNNYYWKPLIVNGHIEPSVNNVINYYSLFGFDQNLSKFIRDNSVKLVFKKEMIEESCTSIDANGLENRFIKDLIQSKDFDEKEYRAVLAGLSGQFSISDVSGLDEMRAKSLIDLSLLDITRESIISIRRTFGDHSSVELRAMHKYPEKYANAVDAQQPGYSRNSVQIDAREAIETITNDGLTDAGKLALLEKLNSVQWSEGFSDVVGAEIIRNHFSDSDIELLNEIYYEKADEGIRNAVVERCVTEVNKILTSNIALDIDLLASVLTDETLGDTEKAALILASDAENNYKLSDFKKLFVAAGFNHLLRSLTSMGVEYVPFSNAMEDLLDVLVQRGYISSYSRTADGRLKVNAKRLMPEE